MSCPSEFALSYIGTEITYHGPRCTVTGVVTDVERTWSTIHVAADDTEWNGIRFRIKPNDGKRAFWTGTFPDRYPKVASS